MASGQSCGEWRFTRSTVRSAARSWLPVAHTSQVLPRATADPHRTPGHPASSKLEQHFLKNLSAAPSAWSFFSSRSCGRELFDFDVTVVHGAMREACPDTRKQSADCIASLPKIA
jgi:hypothetical protein